MDEDMFNTIFEHSLAGVLVSSYLCLPHKLLFHLTMSKILDSNHCVYCLLCRLSPQLSQEVLLDEVSDSVLVDMMWETQMYLFQKRETLQSLAKLLLDN